MQFGVLRARPSGPLAIRDLGLCRFGRFLVPSRGPGKGGFCITSSISCTYRVFFCRAARRHPLARRSADPPPVGPPTRRPSDLPILRFVGPADTGSILFDPASFLPAGRSRIQPAHPAGVSSSLACGRSAGRRLPPFRRLAAVRACRGTHLPLRIRRRLAAVLVCLDVLLACRVAVPPPRAASGFRHLGRRGKTRHGRAARPPENIPASSMPPRAPARPPHAECAA